MMTYSTNTYDDYNRRFSLQNERVVISDSYNYGNDGSCQKQPQHLSTLCPDKSYLKKPFYQQKILKQPSTAVINYDQYNNHLLSEEEYDDGQYTDHPPEAGYYNFFADMTDSLQGRRRWSHNYNSYFCIDELSLGASRHSYAPQDQLEYEPMYDYSTGQKLPALHNKWCLDVDSPKGSSGTPITKPNRSSYGLQQSEGIDDATMLNSDGHRRKSMHTRVSVPLSSHLGDTSLSEASNEYGMQFNNFDDSELPVQDAIDDQDLSFGPNSVMMRRNIRTNSAVSISNANSSTTNNTATENGNTEFGTPSPGYTYNSFLDEIAHQSLDNTGHEVAPSMAVYNAVQNTSSEQYLALEKRKKWYKNLVHFTIIALKRSPFAIPKNSNRNHHQMQPDIQFLPATNTDSMGDVLDIKQQKELLHRLHHHQTTTSGGTPTAFFPQHVLSNKLSPDKTKIISLNRIWAFRLLEKEAEGEEDNSDQRSPVTTAAATGCWIGFDYENQRKIENHIKNLAIKPEDGRLAIYDSHIRQKAIPVIVTPLGQKAYYFADSQQNQLIVLEVASIQNDHEKVTFVYRV
ncbi:hypothetical protein BDF20DRAFT_986453 [Mycotypha africana]|uniref:uncharacterized protein n=1 Tax=Mycotypha africana TaxID=64632 RepID=UPI00230174C7|nr:uncharacterized protein BDF20DRAFT_986453 [Mycotypha africana]KAI8984591.1 hypothetical protein BDF20DRAFT_986453 [Mycotypha africana]